MTTFGLTANGLVIKQQTDIIKEMQATIRQIFGSNVNFSNESNFQQLVGTFSEREALVWQLVEAVYNSRYPSGAEGKSVDDVLSLAGLKRLAARPSTVQLLLLGTPGTVIPTGSVVQQAGNAQVQFKTDIDATIVAAQNAIQTVNFTAVPNSGKFNLNIAGFGTTPDLLYSDNAAAIQTKVRTIVPGMNVTGSFSGNLTFEFAGAQASTAQSLMTVSFNSLMIGSTVVNVSVIDTQDGHPAQATVSATCSANGTDTSPNGPTFAAAGSLTVIGSPVSGWSSVTNPLDTVVGRNLENDTEAIIRYNESLSARANGPLQAIVQDVRAVSGVTQAIGFENTTLVTDGFGRPGKSFEIVALGGADADIAQAIYNAKPAGILAYGSTLVTVTDSDGFTHDISFSRPTTTPIYISIDLQRDLAKYPSNGAQTIQSELVAIGRSYKIGQTIIVFGTNGLVGAFNDVPGVVSYTLKVGTSPNPTLSNNIPMGPEEIGGFDTSRIIINYI